MKQTEALLAGPEARRISGGISESTQRRLIAAGKYPVPIILSRQTSGRASRVAWIESEVREWVARQIAQARG